MIKKRCLIIKDVNLKSYKIWLTNNIFLFKFIFLFENLDVTFFVPLIENKSK